VPPCGLPAHHISITSGLTLRLHTVRTVQVQYIREQRSPHFYSTIAGRGLSGNHLGRIWCPPFLKVISTQYLLPYQLILYSRGYIRTANEESVRIQYKCLVPIYIFPKMKLLFTIQNYNVLSPSSYIHISAKDLYISRIRLSILLQENMLNNPGNI